MANSYLRSCAMCASCVSCVMFFFVLLLSRRFAPSLSFSRLNPACLPSFLVALPSPHLTSSRLASPNLIPFRYCWLLAHSGDDVRRVEGPQVDGAGVARSLRGT